MDNLGDFTKNHYFGFKDIDSLESWFPNIHSICLINTKHSDIQVVTYDADKEYVTHGNKQLIFIMKKAYNRKVLGHVRIREYTREVLLDYRRLGLNYV